MATLSTLSIDLVANSAQLARDLRKANKSTSDWAKKTRQHANTAGAAFGAFATATTVSLATLFATTSRAADELGKTADKLGEFPERLQAIQRAGELTGVSINTTNMALQRMTRRTAEAAQGTGEAVDALKELNLDAQELARLSPADQFELIADAMGGVATQGDRVRLAMKLFDSEGVALVNTLALGETGLRDIRKEVDDFGLALTRVDIAKIEAANNQIFRAKEVTKAFGNQLTVELAPVVAAIANSFAESAKEAGGMGVVGQRAAQKIIDAVAFAADAVNGLKVVWLGVKSAIVTVADFGLKTVSSLDVAVTSFLNKIPGVTANVNESLAGFTAEFSEQARLVQEEFQAALLSPPPSEKIHAVVKDIFDRAQEEAEAIASNREENVASPLAEALGGGTGQASQDEESSESNQADPFGLTQQKADEALTIFSGFLESKNALQFAFNEERNARILELEQQLADATNDIERQKLKNQVALERDRLKNTKSFFTKGFSDLAQNSRKAFELQKGVRIAETVQNTYAAAMGAYKALAPIPIVGPALGAAAAAAAIAFGSQQIQGIKNQSFKGGSVSRSGSPASVSASSSASEPASANLSDLPGNGDDSIQPRTLNVTVSGVNENGLLPVSTVRGIMDQIAEQGLDGYNMNVEFVA